MPRYMALSLILLLPSVCAWAQTTVTLNCQLAWDQVQASDLKAYRAYRAATSRGYVKGTWVKEFPAAPTTATTPFLASCEDFGAVEEGVAYFLAVTAVDRFGKESDFSNEVYITIQDVSPPAPGDLRVISVTVSPSPTTP
jgi:hypothetical protein